MGLARTLRTARHIPLGQLAARARFLWLRTRYAIEPSLPFANASIDAAGMEPVATLPRIPDEILWPEGLDAVDRRAAEFARGRFVYLNREADFAGGIRWHDEGASPLWLYQLQYLGSVADLARTGRVADAARVLAAWRQEYEGRWDAAAWHPYPASLRLVNLCVAAASAGGFDALGPGVGKLAAVHAAYVLRHVEHDVRGNHILENARALLWAGRVFHGGVAGECDRTARAILEVEVPEQVLPDGGHFEMSPMYHCIVMRDLLEMRALLGAADALVVKHVAPAIHRMGDFLAGILCPDGDIPLLGDSVRNFGPPPAVLLRLAGVTPKPWTGVRSFPDTGLYVLKSERIWAIFDAGPVCPSYLPAHGQADTLTVEVWVDGACVVGDPGVFDYSGPEREWGRSSRAHSTITVDDEDTSEVYGNFRVGGRVRVQRTEAQSSATVDRVQGAVRPYGTRHRFDRTLVYERDASQFTVWDRADESMRGVARSRLHLHPSVAIEERAGDGRSVRLKTPRGSLTVLASHPMEIDAARVSREFGLIQPTVQLVQRAAPLSQRDGGRSMPNPQAVWTIRPS